MKNLLSVVSKTQHFKKEMLDGFEFVDIIDSDGDKSFVEKEALEAFGALAHELETMNIMASIRSAGRTPEDQARIAEELAREEGQEYVDRYVAKPLESEHHLGTAIDVKLERLKPSIITRLSKRMRAIDKTAMFETMHSLLTKYGFIERYKKDKVNITGYPAERWHIRYVGRDNAKTMSELNMCLEEYVQFLEQQNAMQ